MSSHRCGAGARQTTRAPDTGPRAGAGRPHVLFTFALPLQRQQDLGEEVHQIVVDVGGQMSHAVIVSRELGRPCVVAATDATKRIPDGAVVSVDGKAGTVTLLEVRCQRD